MYKEYFQFKENPFNVTADSDFFYSSQTHAEALSHFKFGIMQRKGIMAITGEVGAGKTTLCRTLINTLDKHIKTALVLNPQFSDAQLIRLILDDFGIREKCRSKFALVDALNKFLLAESAKGNNVVIIIDEAQNLKPSQLESIRLLSNLETEKQKLLQIVLVGQPELNDKLKLPNLRQLNQRISVRYHVQPLGAAELGYYINHRIMLASCNTNVSARIKFSEAALKSIYHYSAGTPRIINLLCDRVLLATFVQERYDIPEKIIHDCAKELFLT